MICGCAANSVERIGRDLDVRLSPQLLPLAHITLRWRHVPARVPAPAVRRVAPAHVDGAALSSGRGGWRAPADRTAKCPRDDVQRRPLSVVGRARAVMATECGCAASSCVIFPPASGFGRAEPRSATHGDRTLLELQACPKPISGGSGGLRRAADVVARAVWRRPSPDAAADLV